MISFPDLSPLFFSLSEQPGKQEDKELLCYFLGNQEEVKCKVIVICEAFKHLSVASCKLQSLQMLPWEKITVFNALNEKLKKMSMSLRDEVERYDWKTPQIW